MYVTFFWNRLGSSVARICSHGRKSFKMYENFALKLTGMHILSYKIQHFVQEYELWCQYGISPKVFNLGLFEIIKKFINVRSIFGQGMIFEREWLSLNQRKSKFTKFWHEIWFLYFRITSTDLIYIDFCKKKF